MRSFTIPLARKNTPRALAQLDLELFRLRQMTRLWVLENDISPYKLALLAGVSTSQTHKVREDSWRPSLKLLVRIARALPDEWIATFERDCELALPAYLSLRKVPQLLPEVEAIQRQLTSAVSRDEITTMINRHELNYHVTEMHETSFEVVEAKVHNQIIGETATRGFFAPFFRSASVLTGARTDSSTELCRHPVRHDGGYATVTFFVIRTTLLEHCYHVWREIDWVGFTNDRQKAIFDKFHLEFIAPLDA